MIYTMMGEAPTAINSFMRYNYPSTGFHAIQLSVCVCVFFIKPFFLPVDIQHNQCPCRFFNPRRDTSSVVASNKHYERKPHTYDRCRSDTSRGIDTKRVGQRTAVIGTDAPQIPPLRAGGGGVLQGSRWAA